MNPIDQNVQRGRINISPQNKYIAHHPRPISKGGLFNAIWSNKATTLTIIMAIYIVVILAVAANWHPTGTERETWGEALATTAVMIAFMIAGNIMAIILDAYVKPMPIARPMTSPTSNYSEHNPNAETDELDSLLSSLPPSPIQGVAPAVMASLPPSPSPIQGVAPAVMA